jgi:molybdopterin-guanine dinucleotide biosynthesis protein A
VTVIGILTGGQAKRMGGKPKGLLVAPDGTRLIDRTVAIARASSQAVFLVGSGDRYGLNLPVISDPQGEPKGPLGGLSSLLEQAKSGSVVALACDMPFLTRKLLARLVSHTSTAAALAPRRGGRWEPLCARYDAARARPVVAARLAAGKLDLQGLLSELEAEELPLEPGDDRALTDWDAPEDLS